MKPTIAELRKFYQAAGKDGHAVVHEGKDGSQAWIERFLSNVNKEANEAEGTIVHLVSTPRIDPVYDVMDPFGVDDRALQKNRAVFYNHRWMGPQDLPIGKNMWLRSTREGVLVKTQYAVGEYSVAARVSRIEWHIIEHMRHLQAHGHGKLTVEFVRHRVVRCRPEAWDDPAKLLDLQETPGPGT